jgi:amino acid transporter
VGHPDLPTLTYINRDIGLVLAAYTIWKLLKGTKIIALADIPLVEALERAAQDQEIVKTAPKWKQVVGILWD